MAATDNRRSPRERILVEINIAQSSVGHCSGYAENVSKEGLAVMLLDGQLLPSHKIVLLSFKIWTGKETIKRQLSANVQRIDDNHIVFTFTGDEKETETVVEELIKYKSMDHPGTARKRLVLDDDLVRATEFETETA